MLLAFACLAATGFVIAFWITCHAAGPPEVAPQVNGDPADERTTGEPVETRPRTLSVMTLNIAHGRKRGPHQALQTTRSIQSNLDEVAAVLTSHKPDLVALQEADGPSVLTGKFDHVQRLADEANYPFSVRGEHVKMKRHISGTALLSMLPLHDPTSVTFEPSPPTFSKGFVVSTANWPGADVQVDVVSVHLDFSRKSVRKKQVRELVDHLSNRDNPLIVMGDFNCQWSDRKSAVHELAKSLDLQAYQPEGDDMNTFPKLRRRLDWILISRDLTFAEYRVLDDKVSDHRAVVADVKLTDPDM